MRLIWSRSFIDKLPVRVPSSALAARLEPVLQVAPAALRCCRASRRAARLSGLCRSMYSATNSSKICSSDALGPNLFESSSRTRSNCSNSSALTLKRSSKRGSGAGSSLSSGSPPTSKVLLCSNSESVLAAFGLLLSLETLTALMRSRISVCGQWLLTYWSNCRKESRSVSARTCSLFSAVRIFDSLARLHSFQPL